jgi:hypothetical protein
MWYLIVWQFIKFRRNDCFHHRCRRKRQAIRAIEGLEAEIASWFLKLNGTRREPNVAAKSASDIMSTYSIILFMLVRKENGLGKWRFESGNTQEERMHVENTEMTCWSCWLCGDYGMWFLLSAATVTSQAKLDTSVRSGFLRSRRWQEPQSPTWKWWKTSGHCLNGWHLELNGL